MAAGGPITRGLAPERMSRLSALWDRAASAGGATCGLRLFRVDHQAAAHAFAFALCDQVGFRAEGQMDDAAFARGHGREFVRRTGLADFFSRDRGSHAEFLN